jgi:hypothetical protein
MFSILNFKSSKDNSLDSISFIFSLRFAALSNGELFISLEAVSHANISIVHGEFQLFDLKVEKCYIFCNNFGLISVPFERASNFWGK